MNGFAGFRIEPEGGIVYNNHVKKNPENGGFGL